MAEAGEAGGEGMCGVDSAFGDLALVLRRPSVRREVCARQVDGGLKVFKALGMENRAGRWVPLELIGSRWCFANELENLRVARGQGIPESGAEHSRGAGEKKARRRGNCVDGADVAFLLMNTIAVQSEVGLAGRKFFLIWTIN